MVQFANSNSGEFINIEIEIKIQLIKHQQRIEHFSNIDFDLKLLHAASDQSQSRHSVHSWVWFGSHPLDSRQPALVEVLSSDSTLFQLEASFKRPPVLFTA